jgi:hypothetical protein
MAIFDRCLHFYKNPSTYGRPEIFLFLMVSMIASLPFTLSSRALRCGWFVLNFGIIGLDLYHSLGHNYHLFVWISLFFCFAHDLNEETRWRFILRICQIQILLVYGISGAWKALSLIESVWNSNIVAGSKYLAYAMSQEYINSNVSSPLATSLAHDSVISGVLSILVLIVQLGSVAVCFFPRMYFYWGLLLALFHVGTYITINVIFTWPIVLSLLFLCVYRLDNKAH